MAFVATAIIGSAAIGAGASIYAANQQSKALSQASQTIQQGQQQSLGAITKYMAPYAQFGQGLQPTLSSLLTPGPSQTETLQQLPGFQFARDMARYGIQAGAGKTGISGATAVEGGNLESALASQYFSTFTNPLLDLYRTGAVSAGNLGQSAANIYTGGAQSLAGLNVGQGNVQAGLASGIGGSLSNALLIGALTGGFNRNTNPSPPSGAANPANFDPNYTTSGRY